jgi:hypothetical protein
MCHHLKSDMPISRPHTRIDRSLGHMVQVPAVGFTSGRGACRKRPFDATLIEWKKRVEKYRYGELALMHARCRYGVSQQAFPE